jgi:hypothetical protein
LYLNDIFISLSLSLSLCVCHDGDTEALELLSSPQSSEGGLAQAIVDSIFSRKTSDIVEFTYDTDTAAKVSNIGTDNRTPTPSESLMRGEYEIFNLLKHMSFYHILHLIS